MHKINYYYKKRRQRRFFPTKAGAPMPPLSLQHTLKLSPLISNKCRIDSVPRCTPGWGGVGRGVGGRRPDDQSRLPQVQPVTHLEKPPSFPVFSLPHFRSGCGPGEAEKHSLAQLPPGLISPSQGWVLISLAGHLASSVATAPERVCVRVQSLLLLCARRLENK